jgi:hypothetical protein
MSEDTGNGRRCTWCGQKVTMTHSEVRCPMRPSASNEDHDAALRRKYRGY